MGRQSDAGTAASPGMGVRSTGVSPRVGQLRRGSERSGDGGGVGAGDGGHPQHGGTGSEGPVRLESGGDRDVTRAGVGWIWAQGPQWGWGLGALSPGRGVPGGGTGASLDLEGCIITGHGGSGHGGNGVPPGLGRLGTWRRTQNMGFHEQVCHRARGTGTAPGLQGQGCGGAGDVIGAGGAQGLEVPGAFLELEEGSNGILSRTLRLGGVTRAGGNWGKQIMRASPGLHHEIETGWGDSGRADSEVPMGQGAWGHTGVSVGVSRLGFHPP